MLKIKKNSSQWQSGIMLNQPNKLFPNILFQLFGFGI